MTCIFCGKPVAAVDIPNLGLVPGTVCKDEKCLKQYEEAMDAAPEFDPDGDDDNPCI